MTIEAAAPAVQLEVTRRARIAAAITQRFAQREDPITAEQALAIDVALIALNTALAAAGYVPSGGDPLKATVVDGDNVKITYAGQNAAATAHVIAGKLAEVVLGLESAIVNTGTPVPVQTANGGPAAQGSTVVVGSQVTGVGLAPTAVILGNGAKLDLGTVTGTGKFATCVIANGKITSTTLSAT